MTPEAIGQLIRTERCSQGLRQGQLAAAAGVGVRFLVEVEGGKPTAQLGKVLVVLKALGCAIDIRLPTATRSVGLLPSRRLGSHRNSRLRPRNAAHISR